MKKIKVHLQYPWKSPDSSYYKNIIDFPPEDVEYTNFSDDSAKKTEVISSGEKFERTRKFKNFLRKILGVVKIPNLTFTLDKNVDLIHCAHCLSLNKKPWVVDTEVWDRVAAGGGIANSRVGKFLIKKRLESKYCKKIICWSEDCKESFEKAFPDNKKILGKITLLHFALPTKKFKKIRHKNVRILFVARWFDAKGGRQTLEVFDRLSKIHKNAEFIFICPIPDDARKKYSKNKNIKILDLVSQEKLFKEVYPSTDIFFYPGFGDSYGFAVPEALMFGLPVISTKTFAKDELVSDGKTGFLINIPKNWKGYSDMNEKLINDLTQKTSLLIKDKKLLQKMSCEAIREAKEKFSIKKRNQKLRKIYEESLK